MTVGVVIDASASLAWLFGETKRTKRETKLLEEAHFVAPALWKIEVANAVLVKERRKQLTPAQGIRFLNLLESLGVECVDLPPQQTPEQLALAARQHQLTAYDAVYLDLAIATGLPLYTLDRNLQTAAKNIGVERIVGPS